MPTKTFYNLPADKQEKLINSALNEFSKVSYHEASINNIINDASISRGSFYMYFTDKEDLFKYLLFSHKNYIEETILNNLDYCHGDLREAFIKSYDEGIRYKNILKCRPFLDNVFANLNLKNEEFLVSQNNLFEKIKDKVDVSNLESSKDLERVVELLINNMFVSLGRSIFEKDINLSRQRYLDRLDIICHGFYRRKNDKDI